MKHITLGKEGERIASDFLMKEGMQVLARNYRWRKEEIDLIVKDSDTLVFVEVKTRTHDSYGAPAKSVTRIKQRHLINAANAYIHENKFDLDVRFDIVSIIQNSFETHIEHMKNAFYPML